MSDSFVVPTGDVKIRITGLRSTLRAMEKAGAASADMKDLMHSVGMIVVHAARPPRISGSLSGTLRAGKGKTKAVVRAGTARVPYAGVIHYGWPQRSIPANPFLATTIQQQLPAILSALDKGIDDLLQKENLK